MATFFSPEGNHEVWEDKPVGYFTVDEWHAAHPAPAPEPPSSEQLLDMLRNARDARLAAMDKYMLVDYPISEGDLALVKAYRAALRALPEQPGAPWDGGGELTPWPENWSWIGCVRG